MRKTKYIDNFLDEVENHFKSNELLRDQATFNKIFANSSYARFLDVHPLHRLSYLNDGQQQQEEAAAAAEMKKGWKEPLILVKYLPQVEFSSGHLFKSVFSNATISPAPGSGGNDVSELIAKLTILHANGWSNKDVLFKQLGIWFIDELQRCIISMS